MLIEIEESTIKSLDGTISDILCFVSGIVATKDKDDNRFNILIDALNDLRSFRNLINEKME